MMLYILKCPRALLIIIEWVTADSCPVHGAVVRFTVGQSTAQGGRFYGGTDCSEWFSLCCVALCRDSLLCGHIHTLDLITVWI